MGKPTEDDDEFGPMPVSTEPDDQLFADVKAFAAQLGLGGGAAMGDDDDAFADFAPQKAKQKVAKPDKKDAVDEKKDVAAKKQLNKEAAKEPVAQPKTRLQAPVFDPLPELPKGGAPPKSLLKRDDEGRWYEIAATVPICQPGASTALETDPAALEAKRQRGAQLLAMEAAAFEATAGHQKGGSNLQWLQQAQRGGTTTDKVAAMAVLVQENPIGNLRSLDGLINMAGKRGGARAVVGTALDALKELWLEVLLPDRKLKFFEQQPLGAIKSGKDHDRALMFWSYEDALKKRYAAFIESLDELSRDNLEYVKDRASKTAYDLLTARPEGESALLSTLVNKLGDPSRKLASKVGYLLTTLLAAHPGMKAVVVREVERFAFRPGLADRARYYAVVFLNQMVLTHKDSEMGGVSLARRLVDLYFTMFKLVMEGKVGTVANLAAQQREKARKEAEARAARRGKKKAGAVKEGKKGGEEKEDGDGEGQQQRGGEMDARMLSALITGVRRAFPFVAAEEVEPLIEAHADALFRLTHNSGSLGVATQALLLLHQLMASRNSVSDRFYRALYAVLASPELTRSTKAPMFLALLFKALKADVSPKRVAAFAKRLLQVASEAPANFACGCLVLTSELLKSRPGLWNAVLQAEDKDSDAVEMFKDAEEKQDGATAKGKKGALAAFAGSDSEADEDAVKPQHTKHAPTSTTSTIVPAAASTDVQWPGKGSYDMRKREPQFSNAERSCFWELLPLASHAHPSVAAMARTLLAGANVSYDGDPIRDLTLHAFLDKFIQKKAKAAPRGDSLMQPLRATGGTGAATGPAAAAAVGAALSEWDARDVAPDDAFFHKFYATQALQAKAGKKKKRKRGEGEDEELVSDAEESDSDAMEDFLAGEEDGGDEGIGADPDRAMDYDYSTLAAAMGEDSDMSGEDDSDQDQDEDEADLSNDEDQVAEESDGVEGDVSDEEGSLEGAEFSDISGSEDDDQEERRSDASDGSDGSLDSPGGGSEDDVSDLEEENSEEESSDGDDAAADAEIAALLAQQLKKHGKQDTKQQKRKRGRAAAEEDDSEAGSDKDVNPFELAEATDSEQSEGEDGSASDSQRDEEDLEEDDALPSDSDSDSGSDDPLDLDEDLGSDSTDSDIDDGTGRKQGNRKKSDKDIFASADDFDDLIVRDLEGKVEEEEAEKAKKKAGYRSKGAFRGGKGGKGPQSGQKRQRR